MIVKSISDFIVGTIDLPSFVCTLCHCPDGRSAAEDPRTDCRSGLKARAQQRTTCGTVLDLCFLCVCRALRERMALPLFCTFPLGGWEGWGIVTLSGSALSRGAKCAGLAAALVLYCLCFLEKLYFSLCTGLSVLTPLLASALGLGLGGENVC